jgi:hypothetical protein
MENIGKYFWECSKIMVASGAVAGSMMQDIPIGKIIMAVVLAAMSAILANVIDSFSGDDDPL